MTKYIPRELLEHFILKTGENVPATTPKEVIDGRIDGNYVLMPQTSTYALGVDAFRKSYENGECSLQPTYIQPDGSRIVRALTFKENLQARVETYNTLNNLDGSAKTDDERLRLFNRWNDSCTGIAYKAGTTKFKIVHQSMDLITIDKDFKEGFLQVDYDFIDSVELDSSDAKYRTSLSLSKVKSHPAWLAAVENDNVLLSEYADIIFNLLEEKYKRKDGMRFWVRSNTETDELRALWVYYLYNYSFANGNYILNINGSFLLVAPSSVAPKARGVEKKGRKG